MGKPVDKARPRLGNGFAIGERWYTHDNGATWFRRLPEPPSDSTGPRLIVTTVDEANGIIKLK